MSHFLKTTFAAFASVAMLASCSSDEFVAPDQGGQEVTVQFTPTIGNALSRANYGDGKAVDRLQYAVYSGSTLLSGLTGKVEVEDINNIKVDITLVTGNTYNIVFWADSNESPYSFNADKGTITYTDGTINCNNENLDAFYKLESGFVATAGTKAISLTRPLAQINIGTNDLDKIKNEFVPTSSAITVSNAYNSFNLLSGTPDGSATVTFADAAIPSTTDYTFPKDGYNYLAKTYVFAAEDGTCDVEMSVSDGKTTKTGFKYASVPAHKNYRTNIYGSLLTSTSSWNVTVTPGFGEPNNDVSVWDGSTKTEPTYDSESNSYIIDSASDLAGFLSGLFGQSLSRSNSNPPTYTLTQNIDMGGNYLPNVTDGSYSYKNIDGNNHTISNFKIEKGKELVAIFPNAIVLSVKNLTIKDATIGSADCKNSEDQYAGAIFGRTYGTCKVENVNIINTTVYGKNKVGAIVGFQAEDEIIINNCSVSNSKVFAVSSDAGCAGGILGYVASKATIENCEVSGTEINAEEGEKDKSRGNGYIVGTIAGTTIINNCSIADDNKLVSNYTINKYVGSSRLDSGTLLVNGVEVEVNLIPDITISNVDDLKNFATDVENGNSYNGQVVRLAADIDLSSVANWTPIGTKTVFRGVFDGANFTISNVNVNVKGNATAGLFASSYGIIKNLTVKNIAINGQWKAGGIIGDGLCSRIENCHVDGGYITSTTYNNDNANNVGGIAGYLSAEGEAWIKNCSVKNITITAYRDLGGIVGTTNNACVVSDNYVENVTIISNQTVDYIETKDSNIGEIYGRDVTKSSTFSNNITSNVTTNTLTIDNDGVVKIANGYELNCVANFTGNKLQKIVLTDNIYSNAISGGYSKTGVIIQNEVTIDGQNNTLLVNQANATWDCAVYTRGGTIKNLTINGGFRGIFTAGCNSDINIENVVLDDVCYTFNSDGGNPDYSVNFKDCTLNGWTSYTNKHKIVTFTNCKFGKGTGRYNYSYCRPYNESTFENCQFESGFELDSNQAPGKITLKGCTVGGVKLTKDNLTQLLGEDAAKANVE